MKAQHSSATGVWGTARELVDLARATLGRIDLDPFSDAATATGARAKLLRSQASRLAAGATAPPHASAVALLPALDPAEAERQRAIFALVGGRLGEVRL